MVVGIELLGRDTVQRIEMILFPTADVLVTGILAHFAVLDTADGGIDIARR